MELPYVEDIQELLSLLKPTIDLDYLAEGDESRLPGMDVTIGADEDGDWDYQTGDNSLMGNSYFYAVRGTVTLYRRSNCKELAQDLVDQIADLL